MTNNVQKVQQVAPVVLVEDSEEDTEAILRALRKGGLNTEIDCFYSGDSVLEYLFRRGPYEYLAGAVLPQLVLLDLNLPGLSGHSVLQQMKQDATLKGIPVVILTSSGRQADVDATYKLGANSYITKPVSFAALVHAMTCTREYWFDIASVPKLAL